MKVWVAAVSHSSGVNVYAARTEEGLYKAVRRYVEENWDDLKDVADSVEEIPEDPRKAVETYFREMEGGGDEYLDCFEEVTVE